MPAKKHLTGDIRIGISGWNYAGWRGVFYPPKLAHKRELAHASDAFPTIEINGTHYSLQHPEDFARWAEETPKDFVFAIKGSRYITHMKRLREPEAGLANFFAQGLLRLGPKLGPILWQFPPNFRFDRERIEPFLALLPDDSEAALKLARRHDQRIAGRTWLKIDKKRKLRHAMEIRHESFVTPEFVALLRKYGVALVCADTVDWPLLMDVTSDFIYCRLHGSEQLYASGYDATAIAAWAKRVAAWAQGEEAPDGARASPRPAVKRTRRDVFVYFDNDAKVRAPFDAQALITAVDKRLASADGTARLRTR
ncbi:MAG TPA: DUF72 domain-containing protein [Stellaceae bacterium]|nr:DUF72 domain-containing protein [Stellaceae bacterium]